MTSTDIEQPVEVVNPISGELVPLTAPDDDLGRWLADVREYENRIRDTKRLVQEEILRRMDHKASWTIHTDTVKLSAPSSADVEEWDAAELRERLLELVDSGDLAIEAVDAAVGVTVTYKFKKAGITALRRVGGRAREIVDEMVQTHPPVRSVKVEVR